MIKFESAQRNTIFRSDSPKKCIALIHGLLVWTWINKHHIISEHEKIVSTQVNKTIYA